MLNTIIIIPCYNEEKRLPIEEYRLYFDTHPEISFLFANDDSKDNTLRVLQSLSDEYQQVHVYDGGINQGKANIVRNACNYALSNFQFNYIGFFDADLATPLNEINKFLSTIEIKNNDLLLIAGSRVQRLGSNIFRNPLRHYFGRFFATAVSNILCLPVYDTQCGAKLLSRHAAEEVYQHPFASRWFFDVEIFARLIIHFGYHNTINHCFEYPLDVWIEKGDTRLTTKDFLRTPLEILKLNRLYHRKIKKIVKSEHKNLK